MIRNEEVFENFDADASQFVFENVHSKLYSKNDWWFWGVLDFEHLKQTTNKIPRKYAMPKKIDNDTVKRLYESKNLNIKKLGNFRMSGETDFNFKDIKFKYYKDLINEDKTISDCEKEKIIKQLEECKKMHHSLCNFSLIPMTGGMNNVKGMLQQDRIDRFIYVLDDYFKNKNNITNYKHHIFSQCRSNKIIQEALSEYLSLFDDIYDYCRKIYKIDDAKFVERFIESGSKEISTANQVREYMNLAEQYWKMKAEFIK